MAEKKIHRLQLDFQEKAFSKLNEGVDELGLPSRAELIRSGLRTLFWMMEKRKQGWSVGAMTPSGTFVVPEFDFLMNFPKENSSPEKK